MEIQSSHWITDAGPPLSDNRIWKRAMRWRTDRIKSTIRRAGFLVLAATAFLGVARSQADVHAGLEGQFTRTVRPFLEAYCISCHGRQQPAAQMDLSGFTTLAALMQGGRRW